MNFVHVWKLAFDCMLAASCFWISCLTLLLFQEQTGIEFFHKLEHTLTITFVLQMQLPTKLASQNL